MRKDKKYGKPPCLFKKEISAEEYQMLLKNFQEKGDWSQAFYIYLDTSVEKERAQLNGQKLRLRARIKNGAYSLELKSCQSEEHWEASQHISLEDFCLLTKGVLPEGEIKRSISLIKLSAPIQIIGLTNTIRKKVGLKEGVLVIGQTFCLSKVYYEIEFRSERTMIPEIIQKISEKLHLLMRGHQPKIEQLLVA
jgi:uncharacterized protein YjbK